MIQHRQTKTITASTYTTADADNGYRIIFNNATGVTVTLHAAAGRYNFDMEFDNIGAGNVTVGGQTIGQYQHAHIGNNGGTAWTVAIGGGGGGSSNFVSLTDTPEAYTGAGGQLVVVKLDESGLEFVDAPSGASGSFDYGLVTDATNTSQDYGGLA